MIAQTLRQLVLLLFLATTSGQAVENSDKARVGNSSISSNSIFSSATELAFENALKSAIDGSAATIWRPRRTDQGSTDD